MPWVSTPTLQAAAGHCPSNKIPPEWWSSECKLFRSKLPFTPNIKRFRSNLAPNLVFLCTHFSSLPIILAQEKKGNFYSRRSNLWDWLQWISWLGILTYKSSVRPILTEPHQPLQFPKTSQIRISFFTLRSCSSDNTMVPNKLTQDRFSENPEARIPYRPRPLPSQPHKCNPHARFI